MSEREGTIHISVFQFRSSSGSKETTTDARAAVLNIDRSTSPFRKRPCIDQCAQNCHFFCISVLFEMDAMTYSFCKIIKTTVTKELCSFFNSHYVDWSV